MASKKRWARVACAVALTAVAALAAGCSAIGAGDGSGSGVSGNTVSSLESNLPADFGAPEKSTLNVGAVPAMDSAGFFVALSQGLFGKEGLTIKYTPATSSETAIAQQLKGQLDISAGNYVSYIQQAARDPNLADGEIAAAVLPEPFARQAEQQYGAVPLADLSQGATDDFPVEGYVVTKAGAQKYPNTLKRVLAAQSAGQEIADTDRAAVETAFETLHGEPNGQVTATIASVMALDTYLIGIDQVAPQRVTPCSGSAC